MTVQAQDSVQYYSGPISVGTELSITEFTFIDNSHVSLKIRGVDGVWEYGTDYIVEGADTLVRTVTLNREVEDGQVLAVYLDVPITQNISPEEGGNFPASTNEFVLDKLTYICQMLYERVNRSLQVSVDTEFNGILEAPHENIGKAIIINSTGEGVTYSTYKIDDLEDIVRRLFASISNIDVVAESIDSVNTTAQHISNIDSVSDDIFNVNIVAQHISNVNIVGNDLALGSEGAIYKVNDNKSNIDIIADDIANVNNVATAIIKVNTVANDIANVNTVANDIQSIVNIANDLENIDNASEYADNAQKWAEGTDTEVQAMGGTHSAKGWAQFWEDRKLVINVKDFGAKGDGTTDDRAAIQAAIDSIGTSGGCVYFPSGIYSIGSYTSNSDGKSGLVINKSNVTLLGETPETTIQGNATLLTQYELNQFLLIKHSNPSYANRTEKVNIYNLTFDCNYRAVNGITTTTARYLVFSEFCDVRILKVQDVALYLCCYMDTLNKLYIDNCNIGIKVSGYNGGNCTTLRLIGCFVGTYRQYAYYLDNIDYSSLVSCSTDNLRAVDTCAYKIMACKGLSFTGCGCEGAYHVMEVAKARGLTINGFVAHNCGAQTLEAKTKSLFNFDDVQNVCISGVYYTTANISWSALSYTDYVLAVNKTSGNVYLLDDSIPSHLCYSVSPTSIKRNLDYFELEKITDSIYDTSKSAYILTDTSVTDDGIMYNLSSGQGVEISEDFLKGNSWEIIIPVSKDFTGQHILFATKTVKGIQIAYKKEPSTLYYFLSSNGNDFNIAGDAVSASILYPDRDFLVGVRFTGTQYIIYVLQDYMPPMTDSNISGKILKTIDSTAKIYTGTGFNIGTDRANSDVVPSDIDLKKIKVYKEEEPFFEFTKDNNLVTYHTDYTIAGSLSVSDKGIASNFSDSNYLSFSPGVDFNYPWAFEIPVIITDTTHQNSILYASGYNRLNFGSNVGITMALSDSNNATIANLNVVTPSNFKTNTIFYCKIEFTGDKYISYYKKNIADNWIKVLSVDSTTKLPASATTWKIGGYGSGGSYIYSGSVNMNRVKFYNKGNLKYIANLTIPYSKTREGKLIVDSYYADYVNGLLEKYGFNPFYILNRHNGTFQKPNCLPTDIIDSYATGGMTYKYDALLNCTETGSCTSGTEVTLLKPFADDTNYVLSVPYSAKSKTGFTPLQTGDYIAKGKILLG